MAGTVMEPRKAEILRAIVEEYVETAQPVGSQTVARSRRLGVSSATIRNDMTVLEREGYLVHHLTEEGALLAPERRAVSEFFASAHRALEDLLHETSQLLSRVTDHAAVVVGPQPDAAVVRSVQLVTLQPAVVLAVAVLSNGAVEKEVVHLEREVDESRVGAAAAALAAHIGGCASTDLPALPSTGDADVDYLAGLARDGLSAHRST